MILLTKQYSFRDGISTNLISSLSILMCWGLVPNGSLLILPFCTTKESNSIFYTSIKLLPIVNCLATKQYVPIYPFM